MRNYLSAFIEFFEMGRRATLYRVEMSFEKELKPRPKHHSNLTEVAIQNRAAKLVQHLPAPFTQCQHYQHSEDVIAMAGLTPHELQKQLDSGPKKRPKDIPRSF